ncbi:hypothetical protein DDB_G0284373 [Dictyostelium discoideum AX4]|uniref:Malonyl-CoA:ACP transacylase (MAT) domain-containing protein n=1 Tax=Dictyostelium discoideum TaxID=44689 RepID=Q54PR3_DICDI|nr:hypothetical protein DDB_G0284373 [Dictyostelium discoideum AX4]EAL65235.1 hypothetical protein DDB_G0284373 [Dictyostelium discoideum AX4]|eukprot:XP_638591.1 hypothetical protein DDB_G0284373 [Dictyostelium discoideum AX4]
MNSNIDDFSKLNPIVFHFCGQAVHWGEMALELYKGNKIFRESMDKIDNYLKINYFNGESMLNKLRKSTNEDKNNEDQYLTHSILFMFQVSMFELLKSEMILPSCIFGISCGEMASLYCSGILSLKSVCDLLIERAKLMDTFYNLNPNGIPFFIKMGADQFNEKYSNKYSDLEVSAKFSNSSTLMATCNLEQFEQLEKEFKENNIFIKRIPSKIPFHSSALDCIKDYANKTKDVEIKNSNSNSIIQTYCSYNGKLYDQSNPFNIFESIRSCVDAESITHDIIKKFELNGAKKLIFVEISPHPVLTNMVYENVKSSKSNVFTTVSIDDTDPNVISLSSLNKNNDDIVHINNIINIIKKHTKINK